MGVKCFLVKPSETNDAFLWLRRYTRNKGPCPNRPGEYSYHDNWTPIGVLASGYKKVSYNERFPEQASEESKDEWVLEHNFEEIGRQDERWPKTCACGYVFTDDDEWQNFTSRVFVAEDGRQWPQRELPPGAMYFEDWLPTKMYWDNKTDHHLIVVLPDGTEWNVDSRCNNCTMLEDRTHRCWVRTGEPPNVTAGKGGHTCSAGAGSILTPKWHGFLQNGELNAC